MADESGKTDVRDLSRIEVIIEVPKGSRNKYEIDHDTGEVWLDRLLFTATRYPADYGFVPNTLAEDGDPLDVLVLGDEPTFPGVHMWVRPVASFLMTDEAGPDAKVLCVAAGDPRNEHLRDLEDLPSHFKSEIHHFFEIYKDLEPDKTTDLGGWIDRDATKQLIRDAFARYA